MTIDTRNLDSIDIAPVQLAIAMAILGEMAVNTVHAFFKVDVFHMHRNSSALFGAISRFTDSTLQEWSIDRLKGDYCALGVKKITLTVALEDCLKVPAMAVVVRKLRMLELRIEFPDFREEGLVSCLLYTSPSPRDTERSRMPSSA